MTCADAAVLTDVCDLHFFYTHPLLEGLEPVGEDGCSGSRFTRQDGNEQPSPKLGSQEGKRKEGNYTDAHKVGTKHLFIEQL